MQLGNPVIGDPSQTGILIPGDFSLVGGSRKATVTLSPPFPSSTYIVTFSIESVSHTYAPVHENRTISSFVVNLGTASLSGLASVTWRAELV